MIPFHRQLANLGVELGGLALAFPGAILRTTDAARE